MAEFPAFPIFTDAYLGDTTHLTTIEHGAYLLLLFVAWRSAGKCLPDDDEKLAKYARMTRGQWARISPTIREFFIARDGSLYQSRLTDEAKHVRQVREKQSAAGRVSALKRKGRHSTDVEQTFNGCATPSPSPSPTIVDNSNELSTRTRSKTIPRPGDVDQSVWDDFNTLRKKKSAPVTATALDRIRSEATKAGISLSDALTECCGRGWQGFKADWYLKDQTNERQLQLAGKSTLRGSRPDPSLDLLRAARAAEEEERTGGSGSDNWGTWVALPSSGGG